MAKPKFNKVYSGNTFAALMREYHEDLLVSDPHYRAEYHKAQEEKQHAASQTKSS